MNFLQVHSGQPIFFFLIAEMMPGYKYKTLLKDLIS